MDSHGFKNDGAGFTRPDDPGFTNFPRQTPEDTVFYGIYVSASPPLSLAQSRARLKEIQSAAREQCKSVLRDYYIWQRESFHLELEHVPEPSTRSKNPSTQVEGSAGAGVGRSNGRWRLSGKTDFGDSIADEWVIVHLLRELTRKFSDAWVRITDSDGEFLLAEAAYSIPSWLDPDVASNRVWIHNGGLKLIPKTAGGHSGTSSRKPKPTRAPLSLDEALNHISTHPTDMISSPKTDTEAFFRLRNYPSQIHSTMHTSTITIPRLLAHILHTKPAHISPAVESFYLRDPVSVKPLQSPAHGTHTLTFPPTDLVTVSARFTRVGFAQLRGQEFPAPGAWAASFEDGTGERQRFRLEMGMKLTCGFEMLLRDPGNAGMRCVREVRVLIDEVASGDETLPTDAQIAAEYLGPEDDEAWLDIDYGGFEEELAGRGGSGAPAFGDADAQGNLRRIVEGFGRFVNDEDAGVDGAEFDDEAGSSTDEGDEEDEDEVDERELERLMAEMMHSPRTDSPSNTRIKELHPSDPHTTRTPPASDSESESEDGDLAAAADFQNTMAAIERELRSSGALDLEAPPSETGKRGKSDGNASDPEYQLLKNLLESVEGMGEGPARSLLMGMGVEVPRGLAEGGGEGG